MVVSVKVHRRAGGEAALLVGKNAGRRVAGLRVGGRPVDGWAWRPVGTWEGRLGV